MFQNKQVALQWRLKKRRELLDKLQRLARDINRLDMEIDMLHGSDKDTEHIVEETVYEAIEA